MVERVRVNLAGGRPILEGAAFRYPVLDRVARCARSQGVGVVAFGFAPDHLRLVLDGRPDRVREVLRGLKVGTRRAARGLGIALPPGEHDRWPTADVETAVCWAHQAAGPAPLASPWTSHRDLLGYRQASFFDPGPLVARVDAERVHLRCGGEPLPRALPEHRPADLSFTLRVAAAILGVLPADRRCFRLFVHLAVASGRRTAEVAAALALTTRRIRQLRAEPERLLPVALVTLGDPRLSRVP